MINNINEEIKKEIYKLIALPEIEINDIPELINIKFNTNFDYDSIYTFLSDEFLKHNLDHGRRLCCRF